MTSATACDRSSGPPLPAMSRKRATTLSSMVSTKPFALFLKRLGRLRISGNSPAVEPRIGGGVFRVRHGEHQVAAHLVDSGVMELSLEREENGFVAGHVEVGHTQDERLVALVGTAIQQVRGFGVGARHDDSGHAHNVELKTRGIEALDLLVLRHQHFAALVSALLHAWLLVFDVVARYTNFHEAANQVPDVGVSSVAGIGIGDNEWSIVDFGRSRPLFSVMRERKKC